jgi:hypothetical protein
LGVTGVSTLSGGAVIEGMTVGRGLGGVASNTAVGSSALNANTSGSANVGVGNNALRSNTTALGNVAVGDNALNNSVADNYHTAIGWHALTVQNGASNPNTAIGANALASLTTGGLNVGVGNDALYSALTGSVNTAIGTQTLFATTGSYNTAIGAYSGGGITSGSNNVILGSYQGSAAPISATGSNYIVLSDGAGNVRQTIDPSGNAQFPSGAVVVYAPAPASFSAGATLTNADLQTQLIVTSGTSFTLTMPTGTTLDTLISWSGNDLGYDFSVINTTSAITIAANTGVTTVGSLTVALTSSARFRIRRTAASTYIVYRIG